MITITLTESYLKCHAIPRGFVTSCSICGKRFQVGDRVVKTNNKNGSKYYCPECFYTVPKPPESGYLSKYINIHTTHG
jgi:uncharacterized protein YlaI